MWICIPDTGDSQFRIGSRVFRPKKSSKLGNLKGKVQFPSKRLAEERLTRKSNGNAAFQSI